MKSQLRRALGVVAIAWSVVSPSSAWADEIWVAPTHQRDLGGLGMRTNTFWPVTRRGAVRLTFGVPDDLLDFGRATLVVIV